MSDKHEKAGRIVEGAVDDLKDDDEVEAGKKIMQANRSDLKGAEVLDEIEEDAGDRDG
jgi:hypothetical protein